MTGQSLYKLFIGLFTKPVAGQIKKQIKPWAGFNVQPTQPNRFTEFALPANHTHKIRQYPEHRH